MSCVMSFYIYGLCWKLELEHNILAVAPYALAVCSLSVAFSVLFLTFQHAKNFEVTVKYKLISLIFETPQNSDFRIFKWCLLKVPRPPPMPVFHTLLEQCAKSVDSHM